MALALTAGITRTALAADDLLEPDRAFGVRITQKDKQTLIVEFDTAKNYYLYKDTMRFSTKNSPRISIHKIHYPTGIIKQDPNFWAYRSF